MPLQWTLQEDAWLLEQRSVLLVRFCFFVDVLGGAEFADGGMTVSQEICSSCNLDTDGERVQPAASRRNLWLCKGSDAVICLVSYFVSRLFARPSRNVSLRERCTIAWHSWVRTTINIGMICCCVTFSNARELNHL